MIKRMIGDRERFNAPERSKGGGWIVQLEALKKQTLVNDPCFSGQFVRDDRAIIGQ